jgi:hypothetical protein
MSIQGRASAAATQLALWAGLAIVVLTIVLTAIGFLVASLFIWIDHYKPDAVAAVITGGALLLAAIVIFLIGRVILKKIKKPQPSLLAEFGGIAGTAGRIAGLLIRRDPRKSLILAVIAGALAEYVTSDSKKRN